MQKEFELAGRKFRLNKINALKQFHVARRISPILSDILPAMKDMKKLGDKGFDSLPEDEKFDHLAKFLGPFMKGFQEMSDKDSELVLFSLLNAIEVYQDQFKTWARVANDNVIMMQDLELPVLLQIAGHAFVFNLAGFFTGPLP